VLWFILLYLEQLGGAALLVDDWGTGDVSDQSWFNSWWEWTFMFPSASRLTLEHTWPPVSLVIPPLSREWSGGVWS